MQTLIKYDNNNYAQHAGLVAVSQWLLRIMGKPKNWGDRGWFIWESALAIVNHEPLPPVIKEGSTNRDWRAAKDRIETVNRILAGAK